MKKSYRLIIFILLLALAMVGAYRVLSWKDTSGDYLSSTTMLYSTEDNTIDVLFVGSSHVYCSINPAIIWEDMGISSFDLATSGQDRDTSKHIIIEALKTQSPKVVFVDAYGLCFEDQLIVGNEYRNMLAMKPSINSIRLCMERIDRHQWADYILRWPIVHTRYRELTEYDFHTYEPSIYGRGYIHNDNVEALNAEDMCHEDIYAELSESQTQWIDELIDMSNEEGFELVFFAAPFMVGEHERRIFNSAEDYLATKSVRFIDLNEMADEIGLDYSQDFCDTMHTNDTGAVKVTKYIEQYLSEYNLSDHRGDERYHLWDECLSNEPE